MKGAIKIKTGDNKWLCRY